MNNKAYNTHLVRLWLDNDRGNYLACGTVRRSTLNNNIELVKWLSKREYGGDKEKISFDISELDLGLIRETIKDNMASIHA